MRPPWVSPDVSGAYGGRGLAADGEIEGIAHMTVPVRQPSGKLWREFKGQRKQKMRKELRNRLIEKYLPLVRYTAERIRVKLPNHVELDDLMSAGVFGLIDAIESEGVDPTPPAKDDGCISCCVTQ